MAVTRKKSPVKRVVPKSKYVSVKNPYSIKEIHVEKLFGHYNYTLPDTSSENDFSKLFILYGDNGSGKTTILKCVFFLLSTTDGAGHKSSLANIKFKGFKIKFENEIEIGAQRGNILIGSYKFYIKKGETVVHEVNLKANDENSINLKKGSDDQKKLLVMLNYIAKLNITIYFLGDDRNLLSKHSIQSDKNEDTLALISDNDLVFDNSFDRFVSRRKEKQERLELEKAIDNFIKWIRKRVIDASSIGEKNTINIYTDLVKSLSKIGSNEFQASKEQLLNIIKDLSFRSIEYADLGLISTYEYNEILDVLARVRNSDKIELIYIVIKPLFDSLEARLNALEGLKSLLVNFVTNVNNYFSHKTIQFHLSDGFSISHEKGEYLNLSNLSSGEKQLLLLFINAITASEEATIFIIDEPEISLNIKWQRNLLKTLLDFSSNSKIQFVIATHSIELLASNLKNVAKVEEL